MDWTEPAGSLLALVVVYVAFFRTRRGRSLLDRHGPSVADPRPVVSAAALGGICLLALIFVNLLVSSAVDRSAMLANVILAVGVGVLWYLAVRPTPSDRAPEERSGEPPAV